MNQVFAGLQDSCPADAGPNNAATSGAEPNPWVLLGGLGRSRASMRPESDTCLVVVTVFKIVAPTFCVGG